MDGWGEFFLFCVGWRRVSQTCLPHSPTPLLRGVTCSSPIRVEGGTYDQRDSPCWMLRNYEYCFFGRVNHEGS